MTDHDGRLTRHYRELAREEPSAALDTAILAASRRATARPFASRRWATPVSVAAILVLAVGVTLRMRQEQPGIEIDEPAGQRPLSAAPATEPEAKPPLATQAPRRDKASPPLEKRAALAKPSVAARPQPTPQSEVFEAQGSPAPKVEPRPFADAPASPPTAPPAAAPPATARAQSSPAPAASGLVTSKERAAAANRPAAELLAPRLKLESADAAPATQSAPSPAAEAERELERIARLRIEGRHGEADKALEEFRRKYSDFRIPEAMWERVKPR